VEKIRHKSDLFWCKIARVSILFTSGCNLVLELYLLILKPKLNFKILPPEPPALIVLERLVLHPVMTSNGIASSYPPKTLTNYIGGAFSTFVSDKTLPVTNPYDGSTITSVVLSKAKNVDSAVQAAQKAFEQWSKVNVKTRILKLMKLHQLMTDHLDELADMVVREHGKNIVEAKASITKGMETLEVIPVYVVDKWIDCSGQSDFLHRQPTMGGIWQCRGG